jgi:Zn-dependent protease with chaperone function
VTATWVLAALGGALLLLGPRLRHLSWLDSSPRLGIALWQALCASAVAVPVLVGLTLLVPATAWVGGVAALVHACALSLQQAYGFHGDAFEPTLGLLLAATVLAWTGGWLATEFRCTHLRRAEVRRSLAMVSTADPGMGIQVVDSPAAAAFCVPGRTPQVVVTAGALAALSDDEMAGVLAHERAHLRGRHHLAVTAARALSRAFPGIRLFTVATHQTARLVELAADDRAARDVDRFTVASAIVRLATMRAPHASLAMADCTTPGATAARVGRLLAPEDPLPPRRLGAAVATLVGVLSLPVAVALTPAAVAGISHLCTGIT